MGQTLTEKLVARACGQPTVTPGDLVTCKVDLAMMHDSGGPRRVKPMLERLGARVWDPDRVVVITDHYVPATDEDSRQIVATARDWVQTAGIRRFHDSIGICHVVLAEQGHLRPGLFAVGGDSHSPTGGAFGCYMFGIGATEMLGVLVTGEIWLRVPQTIRLDWSGRLARGLSAKDMMLAMCARLGMDGGRYQSIEYAGEAVRALGMQERMTLSNMAAELGAQAGIVEADATTRAFLAQAGLTDVDIDPWHGDADAVPAEHHAFDASALAPHAAAPHSPANSAPISDHGRVDIDVAYIGACTGAKLVDLRMAAEVLRGRRIAAGMRLLVGPATAQDEAQARDEGTLGALIDAGAELLPNACGACAGYGAWRFEAGTRVLASTARNFKGRMGSSSAEIWLGSPYTVAAAAVTGTLTDPRLLLDRAPGVNGGGN
jgi:3-isopropylmalate/(R)-2-methylmalate dehydratase large subunit